MCPSSTIRPATPEDAHGITRIHVGSWKRTYRGILPDERLDALSVEERTPVRRRHLSSPDHPDVRNWVLVEEGAIIGWAAAGPARDDDLGEASHELRAIYLDADRIGEGHGRALMQHCLADATRRGFGEMIMWVLTGNERARRFYEAAGFVADARRTPTEFEDTGATKLRMVRRLSPDGAPPAS